VPAEMHDVLDTPRHEIVDGDDLVSTRQQKVHEMRAKKARAARDDGDGFGRSETFAFRTRHVRWFSQALCELLRPLQSQIANQKSKTKNHFAPVPISTTGIVRQRIFKSSQRDQLSMYSKSSRTQSRKS